MKKVTLFAIVGILVEIPMRILFLIQSMIGYEKMMDFFESHEGFENFIMAENVIFRFCNLLSMITLLIFFVVLFNRQKS